MLDQAFADELLRRRTALGLTQQEVAERTGLSVTYIRTLERAGATPSISTLVAVAAAFGLTPRELIESMERGGPTGGEAARLLEAIPEDVQSHVLKLVRAAMAPGAMGAMAGKGSRAR